MPKEDNLEEIDKDEAQRNQAIGALITLTKSRGWKLVVQSLDITISVIERKLFDELEREPDETDELLKAKRNLLKGLKQAPQNLINRWKVSEGETPELDPYE